MIYSDNTFSKILCLIFFSSPPPLSSSDLCIKIIGSVCLMNVLYRTVYLGLVLWNFREHHVTKVLELKNYNFKTLSLYLKDGRKVLKHLYKY